MLANANYIFTMYTRFADFTVIIFRIDNVNQRMIFFFVRFHFQPVCITNMFHIALRHRVLRSKRQYVLTYHHLAKSQTTSRKFPLSAKGFRFGNVRSAFVSATDIDKTQQRRAICIYAERNRFVTIRWFDRVLLISAIDSGECSALLSPVKRTTTASPLAYTSRR